MGPERRLPVRQTVGAAYTIVAKAPIKMLGLAAIPLLGLGLLVWVAFEAAEPVGKGAFYLAWAVLAGYLLQYALFILILGALVQGAAQVDRRESFTLASSLAASLRRLPQLLGASPYLFVMGTSFFYGLFSMPPRLTYALPVFLLSLVAALILALSMPVCLLERRGPIASLARALRLARGSRWRLAAALLVALAPILGLTILLVSVVAAYPVTPIIAALGFMAMTAVLTALTAVAHRQLAPGDEAAAAVFD